MSKDVGAPSSATRWVCRWCVSSKGIRGSDLANWPAIDDEEGHARHIESEHHIPVRRKDETTEQCIARFKREQPESGGPDCRCPRCAATRRFMESRA